VMNKNIIAVFPADEPKTFGFVKPLHSSF
jgi:hypothetical protein